MQLLPRIDDYLAGTPRPRWIGYVVLLVTVAIVVAACIPRTSLFTPENDPFWLLFALPSAEMLVKSRYGVAAFGFTALAVLQPGVEGWLYVAAACAIRGVIASFIAVLVRGADTGDAA